MKFKKISDDVIRCTITAEEMSTYDIKLDDLLDNRDKAEKFLRYVLQEAHEELNFTTNTDSLSVQLSVMNDGDLSMMISNGRSGDLRDMIDQLKNTLGGVQLDKKTDSGQLLHGIDAVKAPAQDSADVDLDQEAPGEDDIAVAREGEQISANRKELLDRISKPIWAEFSSLDTAIRLAEKLPEESRVPSQLYRRRDRYYLRMSFADRVDEVSESVLMISEYADTMYAEEDSAATFMEHAECIIDKDALKVLASL